MEEEQPGDSPISSKDSQSNESTNAENMLGITDKSLQKNPDDHDKQARRIHYMKESLKTYQIIKKNMYLGRKKRVPTEDDIFVCDCIKADPANVPALSAVNYQVSYNCGDKCINRYMCTECEISSCPCGEYCQNRRFQKHQDTKVYPKPTEGKGWGLFAGTLIKKGQFIMQYIGEVYSVTCEEAQIRIEAYSKSTCTYLMKISSNEVIDPTFKGNMARFINHSCDPNCITQKWNVLGETCVGIFAIRDIPENCELTFDYQFDSFKTPLTKCLCGAYNCKGYLGRKPHELSLEEWEEKLEYLPCSICGQNVEDDEEKLIQCESCHEAYHIFCLDPPLKKIPKESWWCDKCKVKKEEEEKVKKNLNPLEMNRKLYETVKKKIGKFQSIEMKSQMIYQSSDEEEFEDEMRPKYTAEYEEIYRLQKRLELEAMREKYSDLYPPSEDEDTGAEIRIKKKSKNVPGEGAAAAAATTEQPGDKDKEKDKDRERNREREKERGDRSERERDKSDKDREKDREREKEGDKDKDLAKAGMTVEGKPGELPKQPYKSKVQEFKEKALSIFNEKLRENNLWSQILEVERRNGETYSMYGDKVEIDRRSKMINTIQLDIIKKNQIVFRRIGIRLFWEHHSGRINIYKKNIETTLMGNREQLRITELVFDLLEFIADEVERMRGQREARVRLPAMFLRKITGAYHNQQAAELENRYEVSIQYSREYLNDECYPLTLMTDMKVKGVKDSLIAVHRHINHKVKKLRVRRLYCNRRDYTTLLQNLNIIRRKIHPTELRFNKTKEGALKELNHPFYYIQYKDREVALIGTEREIAEAERILEETFKDAHSGSDEAEFGCVHYLWPTTNMNQQIMQQYKAEIEKEVTGTRFVYFEPIVPRKNMTLSIFGSFKEILRAKEILKEKLEALKSTNLTLEGFQEHVKYQMLKYLFKCLHNFFITNNIADIKFWDLQSVEFEKISDMTPLRKQVLRNIFTKDINFQIYVLFVCDFSKNNFFNIMKLSTRSTVELLRKFVQNTLNSNSLLLGRMKCESVLRHDRDPSPYSSKKYSGSYGGNDYSSRDQTYRGSRRSHERSSTRDKDRSDSRESRSARNRSRPRHSRGESQQDRPPRSPYYGGQGQQQGNYMDVQSKRESGGGMIEEYKDEGKSSSRFQSSYDQNKGNKGSSSYADKFKSKDRVPQFSDRYMYEKSQSEKVQQQGEAYQSDRNIVGKKSESDKGEKRSDEYGRRSDSKERSGSQSKKSSFSESGSNFQQRDDNRQQQRGVYNKDISAPEGTQSQMMSNFYERNPNYNKDVEDYMSANEQELGYYERRLLNKKKNDTYGGGRREKGSRSLSKSKSRSRSPDSRRGYTGRDKPRSRSKSKDRSRSNERIRSSRSKDRNKRRGERSRSRDKGRNRNYRYRSRSKSNSRNRRMRSKSKSRSRNRNRPSRSSSRDRGLSARYSSKYGADRGVKKGRFDVEPQDLRQEEQSMKVEENEGNPKKEIWTKDLRNQRAANEGQPQLRIESRFESQPSSRFEQGFSTQSGSQGQFQTQQYKEERSGNGYQGGEAGQGKVESSGENRQGGAENAGKPQDNTSTQTRNQKSRFSYTMNPPQEKAPETTQQQQQQQNSNNLNNYYVMPQQMPQYQYSQVPQYQQGQPQNQQQNQGQNQGQFYQQMQFPYQYQPQIQGQGQQGQAQGAQQQQQQQPRQFTSQYQSSQNQQQQFQGTQQYQQFQYVQPTQQQQQQAPAQTATETATEHVSRFSSKPYPEEKSSSDKQRMETEDTGRYREGAYYSKQSERDTRDIRDRDYREPRDVKDSRDNRGGGRDNRDRDYRDSRDNRDRDRDSRDNRDYRDVRDIRDSRNTNQRTYESENYKKGGGYSQRRYQDPGYGGQSSGGYGGGKYHNKFQENYGGGNKKVFTTKSNSGMGQGYHSGNFYKDRNKEESEGR